MKFFYTIILLIICGASSVQAQQQGIFSQFMNNAWTKNPAFTGIEKQKMLNLGVRRQWLGIDQAPTQQYINYVSRSSTMEVDSVMPYALPISDLSLYRENQEVKERKKYLPHAFGLQFQHDSYGPFSSNMLQTLYAYHLSVSDNHYLSIGAGLGVNTLRLRKEQIDVLEQGDALYRNYQQANLFRLHADAMLGLCFYHDDYYVGLSTTRLLLNSPFDEVVDSSLFKLRLHHMLDLGYLIEFGDFFKIMPNARVLATASAPYSYSIGMKAMLAGQYILAFNYRPTEAVNARAGILLNKRLQFNYSYEQTLGELGSLNAGSHEILLSFLFNNTTDPQYIW